MRSRPILFRPELLSMIVAGKKTQTRRLDRRWLSLEVGDELWCKERLDRLPRPNIYGRDIAIYARDCQSLPIDWKWQREWLSPLHMPKGAARVFLTVVEKPRIEAVCDISRSDAIAEGVSSGRIPADDYGPERIGYVLGPDDGKCILYPEPRDAFFAGWDAIHPGKRAIDVVVVTFKLREVE